ncbi:hypothetical protein [Bradyrhizobium prioriisuperbiae]|uniref:hypothetical protein n=1 Tax=Bradyrhizobium prioriisuperbiae TaxID=2854389 RepID=UPI0028E35416|nr:hypothetical protein [Bradyrhizobium prioritasuperba]
MAKTQDLLRQRFAEACGERDAIIDAAAPLRRQRDDILAKAQAQAGKAEPLTQRIRDLEGPLYELHNEIATLSRALGGKTAKDAV